MAASATFDSDEPTSTAAGVLAPLPAPTRPRTPGQHALFAVVTALAAVMLGLAVALAALAAAIVGLLLAVGALAVRWLPGRKNDAADRPPEGWTLETTSRGR